MFEGMSEFGVNEIEDAAWDEFCRSGDHIVPNPSFEHSDIHSSLGSCNKKLRSKDTSGTEDRCVAMNGDRSGEEIGSPIMSKKRSVMLDKGTLSQTSTGVCPPSTDSESIKEASTSASDNDRSLCHGFKTNNMDSNGSEFCDTVLDEKTGAVDDSSLSYPLEDITQTENDLDFLTNDKGKETNELLFYGWPEIGNFDDVDNMFKSCDSTFGLGVSREDNFEWFSSQVENDDSSRSCSVNDFPMTSGPIMHGDSSWVLEKSDIPFVNGPVAHNRNEGVLEEQTNELKKQPNLQNHLMETTEQYYGNGSYCYADNLSNEVLDQPLALDSVYGYQQTAISYTQKDNCHLYDLNPTSVCPVPSSVKSEVSGLTSISPMDSLHVSCQYHGSGKNEILRSCEGSLTSTKSCIENTNMTMQDRLCDSELVRNPARIFEGKFENRNDIDGVSLVPEELGSSSVQESTTVNFGLDDYSLEAASFRQLQRVTEQLDMRTKLCIRDSLYRLARSAEQRHNHLNRALLGEGTENFMDMETDTNPIDRSIAHLLFHRPSEPSAIPVQNSLLLNSPAVMDGSVTNTPFYGKTASKVERLTNT